MQDLFALLILVTAFGGSGVIGILILLSGLFAAQRTSSVIACAVVAAILFAAQIGFIAFWHEFGAAFSGGNGQGRTIIKWSGVAAAALVAGFLAFKLPRTLAKAVETTHWLRDGAKIAAVITVAYVLYLLGIEVLRRVYPPGGVAPSTSLITLVTVLVGLVLAWGLWRHYQWAWYAALVCAAYAVFQIIWVIHPNPSDVLFLVMSTPLGVRLLLLVSLLGVLLFSNARKLCAPQT